MRLNIYILVPKYLEKRALSFTKVTKNNEEINEDSRETKSVSDLEKITKKRILDKENRDVQALLLAAACIFTSTVLIIGSSTLLSTSVSVSAVFVPLPDFISPSVSALFMSLLGSTLLSTSAFIIFVLILASGLSSVSFSNLFVSILRVPIFPFVLSIFDLSMPMPELTVPLFVFVVSLPIPKLSVPPSILSVSIMFVPILRSFVLLFLSTLSMPRPELSLSFFCKLFFANTKICFEKIKTRSVKQNY